MLRCVVIFFCAFSVTHLAEGTQDAENCHSPALCTDDGERYSSSWKMIHPPPTCSNVSTSPKERLNEAFKASLEQFTQELNDVAVNRCPACNSSGTSSPEKTTETDSNASRCFIPVVCNEGGRQSEVNWMQIPSTCQERLEEIKVEEVFNNWKNDASNRLSDFIATACGNCAINGPIASVAIAQLTNATFTPLSTSSFKTCYAPVVCSSADRFTRKSWRKVLPKNCSAKQTIGATNDKLALNRFNTLLQQAVVEFTKVAERECRCL